MLPPFLACLPHKCMHWHCTYVALARTRTPPPATTRGAAYDLRPSCSARTLIEPVVVQSSHYERVQCTVRARCSLHCEPSWAEMYVHVGRPAAGFSRPRTPVPPRGAGRRPRRASAGRRRVRLPALPPRRAPCRLYAGRGYATTAHTDT